MILLFSILTNQKSFEIRRATLLKALEFISLHLYTYIPTLLLFIYFYSFNFAYYYFVYLCLFDFEYCVHEMNSESRREIFIYQLDIFRIKMKKKILNIYMYKYLPR